MMAAAQQLSPFDRRRLDDHLSVCEACSEFYRDMALLGGALATSDAVVSTPLSFNGSSAIAPSTPPPPPTSAHAAPAAGSSRLPAWWGIAAAGIVCFAGGLATAHYAARWNPQPVASVASVHNTSTHESASTNAAPQPGSESPTATQEAFVSRDHEASLESELLQLRHEFEASESELNTLRRQQQDDTQTNQDLTANLTKLHMENDTQQALIRQIQMQLDQARSAHAQDVKLIAMRDDQVRELTTNVAASVSEAADVRRRNEASHLMEQRNLHVVDVYDNNTKGQRSPSFGRVFYSEGGPMMFVAFDLPTSGRSGKTTYHAWGQTEGSSKIPLQLGTFTEDDAALQRWVLRVTDAQLLKQVDAVFITADHGMEVRTPSGPPLLYAYLHQVPNHP